MVYKLYRRPGLRSKFFIVICAGKRIGNNSIGPRKYKNRVFPCKYSLTIFLSNFITSAIEEGIEIGIRKLGRFRHVSFDG